MNWNPAPHPQKKKTKQKKTKKKKKKKKTDVKTLNIVTFKLRISGWELFE